MLTLKRTQGENGCRRIYENEDGSFCVVISTITHHHGAYSRMDQWVRSGLLPRWIRQTLHVSTYFTDAEGRCWGLYNPQEKRQGTRNVVNYEWKLEATPENEKKILAECERRYLNDERI